MELANRANPHAQLALVAYLLVHLVMRATIYQVLSACNALVLAELVKMSLINARHVLMVIF